MEDLIALSSRYIDTGAYEGPLSVNRITAELSEIAPRTAVIEAFSHVVAFETDDGLVLFDTSAEPFAERICSALRGWSDASVHSIVYTHGHVDHVGGTGAFLAEAEARGRPRPRVIAHENVPRRFARYELTNGYNAIINRRQFGKVTLLGDQRFGPAEFHAPDLTFADQARVRVGELEIELCHARGETDDHLWAWLPAERAIVSGDFLCWIFPNAGNPQKVQRYPAEWARALRDMAALEPELLLPAHGLPIAGSARIGRVLADVASVLETIVEQCLALMNAGATLDELIHTVQVPAELLEKPYLRPIYDEPEFVVRNVFRLYGGWYDGNPAQLKPSPTAALAHEIAELAGGSERLIGRARSAAERGDPRLACHLIEFAVQAEPENQEAHAARADIYRMRREGELSLMAKAIYADTAEQSLSWLRERAAQRPSKTGASE